MRKKEPVNAAPIKRGTSVPKTVDEYLDGLSEPALARLTKMRALIRSVLPAGATEIISYRIPAFKHKKILVWFAAFSNHCSLFPTAAVIDALKDELKGFETSKGTIQFPLDNPLPSAMIKKIVKTRLAQSQGKLGEGKQARKPARKNASENDGTRQ
jgi:uncharacterized protein YdhG (YjbR/CyaY superfamily)